MSYSFLLHFLAAVKEEEEEEEERMIDYGGIFPEFLGGKEGEEGGRIFFPLRVGRDAFDHLSPLLSSLFPVS